MIRLLRGGYKVSHRCCPAGPVSIIWTVRKVQVQLARDWIIGIFYLRIRRPREKDSLFMTTTRGAISIYITGKHIVRARVLIEGGQYVSRFRFHTASVVEKRRIEKVASYINSAKDTKLNGHI